MVRQVAVNVGYTELDTPSLRLIWPYLISTNNLVFGIQAVHSDNREGLHWSNIPPCLDFGLWPWQGLLLIGLIAAPLQVIVSYKHSKWYKLVWEKYLICLNINHPGNLSKWEETFHLTPFFFLFPQEPTNRLSSLKETNSTPRWLACLNLHFKKVYPSEECTKLTFLNG